METQEWCPEASLSQQFIDLPFTVYAEDKHWLGEDIHSLKHMFSAANSYFEKGQAWLGCNGNARLAGFFESGYQIDAEPVAFFGYWETLDDLSANTSLFVEFEQWAKSKGAKRVYGPINFSTFSAYRLRVDSFAEPAFLGEPYNPQYYPGLLEQLGYSVDQRYQSRLRSNLADWAEQIQTPHQKLKSDLEDQFTLCKITPPLWLDKLPQLYQLVERAFADNFAYRSISEQDFNRSLGEKFIAKACPLTSKMVLDEQAEVVGFFVCFPDYAGLISARQDKRAIPDLQYQASFSDLAEPRTLLAKTCAVHPEHRSSRIFTWMCNEIVMSATGRYQQICAALMREDNHSLNYGRGLPNCRSYALFSKRI